MVIESAGSAGIGARTRGQLHRQTERGAHAGGIGQAATGEVIRRSVIGGRADKRQTQGPVHSGGEGHGFERTQALIVIHGNHHFAGSLQGLVEKGVRRHRAHRRISSVPVLGRDRRGDHANLLVAQQPAFTGMRVQPADTHALAWQMKETASQAGLADGPAHGGFGDGGGNLAERQVGGDQGYPEPSFLSVLPQQHHGHIGLTRQVGEEFRLPDKRLAQS